METAGISAVTMAAENTAVIKKIGEAYGNCHTYSVGCRRSDRDGCGAGFAFKNISHKFSDTVLGFAAGVMLAAAMLGLILPSMETGGTHGVIITVIGIFCGAVCLNAIDRLVPHLHRLMGVEQEPHAKNNARVNKILLFVLAIAIHNLPEGIAAGVGFGSGSKN